MSLAAGFDRAFRNLEAAPCQEIDAKGACSLLFAMYCVYITVLFD